MTTVSQPSTSKPKGPTYYTCAGCHTRPADADVYFTRDDGVEDRYSVCDRCFPQPDDHIRIVLYRPQCPLCGGEHSPFCR